MADQVGAVDPVDELGLGLQPLHGAGEPARQGKPTINRRSARKRVQQCALKGVKAAVPDVRTRVEWSNRRVLAPGRKKERKKRMVLDQNGRVLKILDLTQAFAAGLDVLLRHKTRSLYTERPQ